MRRFAIAAVLAFCLLPVAGASGATFFVTSTVDNTIPCTPQAPGLLNCVSLRQAVQEAAANADATDEIVLGAGTYTLTAGELVLSSGVAIVGASARTTIIDGGFASRVFRIPAGSTDVILTRMTIDEGFVNNLNGGNILNEGELFLFGVAVTGGFAQNGVGGGIANSGGDLLVSQSLIEGNSATFSGGGIDNAARSGTPGAVDVSDSTISGNSGSTGSAIQTGSAGNSVQLNHVTVAGNAPGIGLTIATTGQTVDVRASIFSTPGNTNCGTFKPTDMGYNVESADTCTFRGTGSQPSVNAQLSGGLTNAGGPTDVFTIAPTSPAANAVAECGTIFDQRGYTRGGNGLTPCDAGAYEIDGQPPTEGGGGEPPPDPTPVPTAEPTPVASAAQTPAPPAPEPTPVAGKSVAADTVGGKVLVKLPGSSRFVPLDEAVIANGSEVDARAGRVEITRADGGRAVFYSGQFKVGTAGGVTVLTLSEPLDCKAAKRSLAAAKKKTRKLWGDGKGAFRTAGKYSAATVRGTKWLVQDTCTTTTTKVTVGTVEVRDIPAGKRIVLRKGKTYVARARK